MASALAWSSDGATVCGRTPGQHRPRATKQDWARNVMILGLPITPAGKVPQMYTSLLYIHSFLLPVCSPCSGLLSFPSFSTSLSPVLRKCFSLCMEPCLCLLSPSHTQASRQSGFKCLFLSGAFFAPLD